MEPLPATMSVLDARDAYLAANGFTVEAYAAKWTDASVLGIRFRVPNTPRHQTAIQQHDLHHVVTGYGTDLIGEGEISTWELRRGLGELGLYVSAIVLSGAALGVVLAPGRMLAAWRSGGRGSLFRADRSYEALLTMSVGELRQLMQVPSSGVANGPQSLHSYAPRVESGAMQPA